MRNSHNARPGLADTIHAQIMFNNKLKHVLTFDIEDFDKIPGIEPIHPMDIESLLNLKIKDVCFNHNQSPLQPGRYGRLSGKVHPHWTAPRQ